MIQKAIRCVVLLGFAALGDTSLLAQSVLAQSASAQTIAPVTFMTAGEGSAFLPYGQGIAAYLATKGITIEVKKSAGSNENLSGVDASTTTIGTAFIGSAYDAVNGTGEVFLSHTRLHGRVSLRIATDQSPLPVGEG